MLYAKLEEEHGLARCGVLSTLWQEDLPQNDVRHALSIYNRATKAVEEKDMFEMYGILLRKTAELFGLEPQNYRIFEVAYSKKRS